MRLPQISFVGATTGRRRGLSFEESPRRLPVARTFKPSVRSADDGARVAGRAPGVVEVLHLPDARDAAVEEAAVPVNPVFRRPESLPRARRVEATAVVIDGADDELPAVRQRVDAQLTKPRPRLPGGTLRREWLNHNCLPQEKKRRGREDSDAIT